MAGGPTRSNILSCSLKFLSNGLKLGDQIVFDEYRTRSWIIKHINGTANIFSTCTSKDFSIVFIRKESKAKSVIYLFFLFVFNVGAMSNLYR